MMEWFRSWHGAPTDPKWRVIGKKTGLAPGMVFAIVWTLMDRASQADERGSIKGYDPDEIAIDQGCEPEDVESVVTALADKGVLEDGRFKSWEKRQPKRERIEAVTSTERVRAHRERKKQHGRDGETPATTDETPCNATQHQEQPPDKIRLDIPPKPPKGGGRRRKVVEYTELFSRFYEPFPRHEGKQDAARAFEALPPDDQKAAIAAAPAYAGLCKGKEAQFIKTPAAWLNGRRWEDEALAKATAEPAISLPEVALTTWAQKGGDPPQSQEFWPLVATELQGTAAKLLSEMDQALSIFEGAPPNTATRFMARRMADNLKTLSEEDVMDFRHRFGLLQGALRKAQLVEERA